MYLFSFFFTLMCSIGCTLKQKQKAVIDSTAFIVIEVQFASTGSFSLDYLDSSYSFKTVNMRRSKMADTVTASISAINKPTVFRLTRFDNFEIQYFLSFPSDTLRLVYENGKLAEKKEFFNHISFSDIIGSENVKDETDRPSPKILSATINLALSKKEKQLSRLYQTRKYIDTNFFKATIKFIELSYFKHVLSLDYSKYNDSVARNKIEGLLDSIGAKRNELENLSTPQLQPLCFSLINASVYCANQKGLRTFADSLKTLNPLFYKTSLLSGCIIDKLNRESKTVNELNKKMNDLAPFIKAKQTDFFVLSKIPDTCLTDSYYDSSKNNITITDLLKSKKPLTVIDFWASWCVPCIAETPFIKRFLKQYGSQVNWVSVSLDTDIDVWKSAQIKYGIDGVISKKDNAKFIHFLEIHSIPRFVVCDNKLNIISMDFFKPSDNRFELEVTKILSREINK